MADHTQKKTFGNQVQDTLTSVHASR